MTADKLVGFMLARCLEGYQSSTLLAAVGSVRRVPHAGGLSDADYTRIRRAAGRMQSEFPYERRHVRPLLDAELELLHTHLAPYLRRGHLFALGLWAALLVARDGCLRSKEFLGGVKGRRGLLASSVTEVTLPNGQPSYAFDVPWRKTSQRGRDKVMDGVVVPRRADAHKHLDGYLALHAYATTAGIALGRSRFPLFARRSRVTGFVIDTTYGDYSYSTALNDLRWVMTEAGFGGAAGARAGVYTPADYALHSPRRGGATLMLAMGVPGPTVMKIGHWADPRSMQTYDGRDTDVAAYVSELFQRADAPARAAGGASHGAARGRRR